MLKIETINSYPVLSFTILYIISFLIIYIFRVYVLEDKNMVEVVLTCTAGAFVLMTFIVLFVSGFESWFVGISTDIEKLMN